MLIIDNSSLQFAVIVDENQKIVGTVTDGDIRRGILKGFTLDSEIGSIMNSNPIYKEMGKSKTYYKTFMESKDLKQLPIVNSNSEVVGVVFHMDKDVEHTFDNTVILMAGGLGTRLRPLTNDTPKPMLNVGDKPMLETIIESFKIYGFTNFVISVNYKKEIIMEYFQDGSAFGVDIEYIEEEKRMGTAGALSLLKEKIEQPIFVMNADLLTHVNFEQVLDFHLESGAVATMCVREYEYQVPYGVIETEGDLLSAIVEKPIHRNFVNAGIYLLSPEALKEIPENQFYDMPDLFNALISRKEAVAAFPIREYWMDIGKIDDFQRANTEYRERLL